MSPESIRRKLRRQPLPPLSHTVGGPLLPNAGVLDEVRSPVGGLLWRVLQDVTLWSTAAPAEREGLFGDAARKSAGVVPELEEELDALAILVRDPEPGAAPVIAHLCCRVRVWAEAQGLYATALSFAQAAALAEPESARYAYEVGRLARYRAEYARSEVWYQRSKQLAIGSGDAQIRVLVYCGLANIRSERGNYKAALDLNARAVRLAQRHTLSEELGIACHGLAALQFEMGQVKSGIQSARKAVGAFGRGHPRTPIVIHDLAVALMDQFGAFAAAGTIISALLPTVTQPRDRMMALANLARVAAGTGQQQLFDAIWTESWPVLKRLPDDGTDALIALGRGAVCLKDWRRARLAGSRALRAAEVRCDGKSIHLAESLLAMCGSEGRIAGHVQHVISESEDASLVAFSRDLAVVLRDHLSFDDPCWGTLQSALKYPHDPIQAYELGCALRLQTEYERARAWFVYGIRVARQQGNTTVEALCLAGMGDLYSYVGNLPLALRFHRYRFELVKREELRELEGDALADLCTVSFALDRADSAFVLAGEALVLLSDSHPLIPRLAHDLAVYLMERRQDFANALQLFEALPKENLAPGDRLLLDASLCWAAAGAGNAQLYEGTWSTVWNVVEKLSHWTCPIRVPIQLARAALTRGHYELALKAASHAVIVAQASAQEHEFRLATNLIEAVREASGKQERASVSRNRTHDVRAAHRLIRAFVKALRGSATRDIRAAHVPEWLSGTVER